MTEPRVDIIVVNWNGKDVTLECLASLGRLTYTNCRIILVDNASTDGSVGEVRRSFPDVIVLGMEVNHGFAGGVNAGIRHALARGTELVMILNNDTTVDREFLSHMVRRFTSDPSVGMVAPMIYYADDPKRIWFAGGALSMWTGTLRHIGLREEDAGQFDVPTAIAYASGCCILTSRSVVESVGMLDESYPMYTEDADWSMRVRMAGYTIMLEPAAKVWHKLSVSVGGHLSWFKLRRKFLGNLMFFRRYASWYHWLVFPWMNILVNAGAALRYLVLRPPAPRERGGDRIR